MATSRERLDQTLNHMEPEEVVVDMGSTPITGINANALDRLRKALGLEEKKVKINEPLQLLGEVEELSLIHIYLGLGERHRYLRFHEGQRIRPERTFRVLYLPF